MQEFSQHRNSAFDKRLKLLTFLSPARWREIFKIVVEPFREIIERLFYYPEGQPWIYLYGKEVWEKGIYLSRRGYRRKIQKEQTVPERSLESYLGKTGKVCYSSSLWGYAWFGKDRIQILSLYGRLEKDEEVVALRYRNGYLVVAQLRYNRSSGSGVEGSP